MHEGGDNVQPLFLVELSDLLHNDGMIARTSSSLGFFLSQDRCIKTKSERQVRQHPMNRLAEEPMAALIVRSGTSMVVDALDSRLKKPRNGLVQVSARQRATTGSLG